MYIIYKRGGNQGTGKTAQRLRVLAALLEGPGLIPSTSMVAHNHLSVTPVPRESDSLWLSQSPTIHMLKAYTQVKLPSTFLKR